MDLSIDSLDKGFYQNSKVNIKSELKTFNGNDIKDLSQRLRIDSLKDQQNRNIERSRILFEGAVEQFLYENKEEFPNSQNVDFNTKIRRLNNFIGKAVPQKTVEKKSENEFFDI